MGAAIPRRLCRPWPRATIHTSLGKGSSDLTALVKKWQVGEEVEMLRSSCEWVNGKIIEVETHALKVTYGDTAALGRAACGLGRFEKSLPEQLWDTRLRLVGNGEKSDCANFSQW